MNEINQVKAMLGLLTIVDPTKLENDEEREQLKWLEAIMKMVVIIYENEQKGNDIAQMIAAVREVFVLREEYDAVVDNTATKDIKTFQETLEALAELAHNRAANNATD